MASIKPSRCTCELGGGRHPSIGLSVVSRVLWVKSCCGRLRRSSRFWDWCTQSTLDAACPHSEFAGLLCTIPRTATRRRRWRSPIGVSHVLGWLAGRETALTALCTSSRFWDSGQLKVLWACPHVRFLTLTWVRMRMRWCLRTSAWSRIASVGTFFAARIRISETLSVIRVGICMHQVLVHSVADEMFARCVVKSG